MALHVLDEANRCLGCKKPMCQQGCPIHTNIPEAIRLLKAGEMDKAGRMLFENNPLTTVCSLVCDHEKQCEGHCIRNRMPSHDPVHFSVIENYISTTYANKMVAGPARDKTGGVMRYGIPNYRLPDSVLDDFQYRHLELKGIKVRTNTEIGRTLTIDDLFRDGYKSIFIGAGLWKANAMHIKGESLGNAAFGIDYLANSKAFRLGDNIAVIGVGNSAMGRELHQRLPVRSQLRQAGGGGLPLLQSPGGDPGRRPDLPRHRQAAGRQLCPGGGQRDLLPPHRRHHLGQPSESGLIQTTTGIDTNKKGLLTVDHDGRTTRPGVFAGGDAVKGARTVVEAVAMAKDVAVAMDEYMKALPPDEAADPYANIPVFETPTSDVFGEQELKV